MAFVALGEPVNQATPPHKSMKVPYSDGQVLIYKNKGGDLCLWFTALTSGSSE